MPAWPTDSWPPTAAPATRSSTAPTATPSPPPAWLVACLSDGLGRLDEDRWSVYPAAVARWELLRGRSAPEPTQTGRHGKPLLAPPFVEWLMGLPQGHVTDSALGLPRALALRVLGNGVVPQQAAAALRLL